MKNSTSKGDSDARFVRLLPGTSERLSVRVIQISHAEKDPSKGFGGCAHAGRGNI
jgi:hypothetical protein